MECRFCADERRLSVPVRVWDPDDGWIVGRFCEACYPDAVRRRPKPNDFAYSRRGEYVSDVDGAIDAIYG